MESNTQKMREALLAIHALIGAYVQHEILDVSLCLRAKDVIKAALSAPARNCDKCKNADEAVALAIDAGVVDCGFGAREMAEFLLAEAEGGAK